MLPLVALLALQTSDEAPFPHAVPAQVVEALGLLGYAFVPADGTETYGRLSHGGTSVRASIWVPGSGRKEDPPRPVAGLDLDIELPFAEEIPLDLEATRAQDDGTGRELLIVPHLGKTASVSGQIKFGEGVTRGQVRGVLDRFWRGTAAYAVAHGGRFIEAKEPDWSKARFADGLVLNVADGRSIGRLTDSWGWAWKKPGGGSTSGWAFPIDVDGTEVDVWQDVNGEIPKAQAFRLYGSVELPKETGVEGWIETVGGRYPWATFSGGGGHSVSASQVVDLRKGVSLGDVRRRIKAFAQNVAALKKVYEPRPPNAHGRF